MTTDVATRTCQHHWVLSDPEDGVILGTCKHCRSTKHYPARLVDDDFNDDLDQVGTAEDRHLVSKILERARESL
jgi:hypothetical protein